MAIKHDKYILRKLKAGVETSDAVVYKSPPGLNVPATMASWESGYPSDCKSAYSGSIPDEASIRIENTMA